MIVFCLCRPWRLVFFFVEEEVFFGGVVGPDVFDAFVGLAFVFHFLKVLDYFEGGAGALGVVDELVFCGGPGGVFKFGCELECPVYVGLFVVHSRSIGLEVSGEGVSVFRGAKIMF